MLHGVDAPMAAPSRRPGVARQALGRFRVRERWGPADRPGRGGPRRAAVATVLTPQIGPDHPARAAGIEPGGPPVAEADWRTLATTGLRQSSWPDAPAGCSTRSGARSRAETRRTRAGPPGRC